MSAKQVIVKKTTKVTKRVKTPKKSSRGKGQKHCPTCGKYM